jgi:hypothetical protein
MLVSLRSVRVAATGALGAGALSSALLFGAAPMAQAAPPGPVTTVAPLPVQGPHGGPVLPDRPGHGWGGHGWGGHGPGFGRGIGHGGWHPGGWGRGGWGYGGGAPNWWGHRSLLHWWG